MQLDCAFPLNRYPAITLAHGGGGLIMKRLIDDLIQPVLGIDSLSSHDSSIMELSGQLAVTTDSYVVRPMFFPGGDIGSLSVHGSCNDLAVSGAKPLAMSCSLIIEEGLPTEVLHKILLSMRKAADAIGVRIVTGDTKVVEKNKGDGLYINTTAIGETLDGWTINARSIRAGDLILSNGDLGRHGSAIMSRRMNLKLDKELESDSAHLYPIVDNLHKSDCPVKCMRDLTRGGLASGLFELSQQSQLEFEIDEDRIPVCREVSSLCEITGLDPLHLANEGRMLVFVSPEFAAQTLNQLKKLNPFARLIGRVKASTPKVLLNTPLGTQRVLRPTSGEALPRIC